MSAPALILLLLGLGQTVAVPGTTTTVTLQSVQDHLGVEGGKNKTRLTTTIITDSRPCKESQL
jgi:hypothetical protein